MKPLTRITQFVLSESVHHPIATRISLYRDLAQMTRKQDSAQLHEMADALEAVEKQTRQLSLDFSKRAE